MYGDIPERPLDPPEYDVPMCPVCKSECERFYTDTNGNIVGCECCVSEVSADEYMADEAEKAYWDEANREIDRRLGK